MIVPAYWAEARLVHRRRDQQLTVRRFGWSDASQEAADAHAAARAKEALDRLIAGEALPNRDRRIPYNGAEGLPIREEIVERHGSTIITRNSYGARCLNTPDVLFADVDFDTEPPRGLAISMALGMVVAALVIGIAMDSVGAAVVTAGVGYLFVVLASRVVYPALDRAYGLTERRSMDRIRVFSTAHPDWNLRIYRTPAGLRVLVTHRTFDPTEDGVKDFFRALGTDPVYVRMCANQRCFRARVSPKPWRIGIDSHIRPRRGVWPVAKERLAERRAWIVDYEAASTAYASCRYVESLGSGYTDAEARQVRELHDELAGATSGRPIA